MRCRRSTDRGAGIPTIPWASRTHPTYQIVAYPSNNRCNAPFLTGGYYASSEPFRDIEDWTHDCILQQDMEKAIKRVEAKNSRWRELVLPVPNYVKTKEISSDSRMLKYLRIAPDKNYSEEFGFQS